MLQQTLALLLLQATVWSQDHHAASLQLQPFGGTLGDTRCPSDCQCDSERPLAECNVGDARVTFEQIDDRGSGIKITCDPLDATNPNASLHLECADVPELPLGRGSPVRLIVAYCWPARELGCVAQRLGASRLQKLSLRSPRHVAPLGDTVDDIDEFYYYGKKSDRVSIPSLLSRPLPALRSLAFNNVQLTLSSEDLTPFPDLVNLELASAAIKELPGGFFSPVTKLKRLKIFNNQIERLSEDDVRNLTSLEALSVANNKLSSLSTLAALPTLVNVSAFSNYFTLLPRLNLTKLEQIQLFMNHAPLEVAPGALSYLPALRDVDLMAAKIIDLPPDTFRGSHSIVKIDLQVNGLRSLPADLFEGLTKLETLDLTGNKLQVLEEGLFRSLESLLTLNLNNNEIAALPPGWARGMPRLRSLSARNNALSALAPGAFADARALRELHLDNNRLELDSDYEQYEYLWSVFSKLEELRVLSLTHNRLVAFPPLSTVRIESVDLSYNNITRLTFNDVSFYNDNATVDLRYNQISAVFPLATATKSARLYDAGDEWPAQTGGREKRRAVMLLDNNPFFCDCRLYNFAQRLHGYTPLTTTEATFKVDGAKCAGPPHLKDQLLISLPLEEYACTLEEDECISNCSCIIRPATEFLELTCERPPEEYPDLEYFGVRNMKLSLTATPASFEIDENIRVLNLSGLGLQNLPKFNQSVLNLLDLSNNSLQEFPSELASGPRLLLSGNQFSCDCGEEESVSMMKAAADAGRILDWDAVKCADGERVGETGSGRCFGRRAAWAGGVLGAAGVIAAVLALLLVRYSLEIRVWLYSKGWFSRWLDDDDDRMYDAFVSFCHKDEEFVTGHLVPGLEAEPHRYKLCVHYRDWIPGEWIPKQISDSVANSRRTIIVLSQNFLESLWGQAEFRTATMSQVHDSRPRLIVVLLDDVTHKELCPELKAYLTTNTYLKWGDPWFWQKLRYALPHRRADSPALTVKQKLSKAKMAKTKSKLGGLHAQLTPDGVLVNVAHKPRPQDQHKMDVIQKKLQDELKLAITPEIIKEVA